jgi:hypothetical protein
LQIIGKGIALTISGKFCLKIRMPLITKIQAMGFNLSGFMGGKIMK